LTAVIEYFAPSFVYSLLKDGFALLRNKHRRLTNSQKIELRQKWKPLFETYIWEQHRNKLTSEIIVRDMRRIDNYPEAKDTKGISPWFRAGLMGTYHRGILAGLGWGTLTKDGENWRFTDRAKGEKGDIKVMTIGSIPYENIDNVDWSGDEYYGDPQVYCFFSYKKEPYEHVGYYKRNIPLSGNALPYYTEFAAYEPVRRFSRRRGIAYFS
jgi:hypothetical protein